MTFVIKGEKNKHICIYAHMYLWTRIILHWYKLLFSRLCSSYSVLYKYLF